MYKQDLALDYPEWLICHKIHQNQTKPIISFGKANPNSCRARMLCRVNL